MRLLFFLLSWLVLVPQLKAVSEAAALFLLIQPSVRANGMAGVSIAGFGNGPLSVAFNPGHVGLAAFESMVNVEFYLTKTDWLPKFNLRGLKYDAKSAMLGYDFRKLSSKWPISFGAAYTRVKLDLGQQIITDDTGPDPIGVFDSSEEVDIWSIGIGIDYFIKLGVGFSFKNIDSNLGTVGAGAEIGGGSASETVYDFGFVAQAPLLELLSQLRSKPIRFGENFAPFLVTSFGFSKSNIGDGITYFEGGQEDPLPRVARMGVEFNTGVRYEKDEQTLKIASFEWSSEAEDLLVKRFPDGNFAYDSGLGDIGFFDNVLKGNANQQIITRQGWELNFLDVLSYRQGDYEDPGGSVSYGTNGYGLNFSGVLRFWSVMSPEIQDNRIVGFLIRHTEIEYLRSSFDARSGNPLDGTDFDAIRISLF